MLFAARRSRGFTLIEMMVTLAVVVVLLMVAIPSFQTLRQRSSLRSSSEEVLAVWNQSRFEAAKRNTWVKFARQTSGTDYCVGADVADTATDTTACDCFETNTADPDYCAIAHWPASGADEDQAEWHGVTLAAPTSATALGTVLIEPKRTFLTSGSTPGSIAFVGPPGPKSYRLYLNIDAFGRGVLCEPNNATHKMSDYSRRTCAQ